VKLNLRALDAFRHTLQSGSATAASRELGISQPAVSRLLARLERDVGFELFWREKGRLVPTPEARILADEVDLALGRLDRIATLARNLGDGAVGELRIVAPPSLVEGPLAPIVASFLAHNPQLRLSISPRDVETANQLIATRAVDCGFGRLPVDHPGVSAERLVTNETVCVLPPRHPLAKLTVIGPADLADVPLILLGQGRRSRAVIDAAFDRAGIAPRVRLETQTVGSACAFAAHGVGVAILNELMARTYLRGGMQMRRFRPRMLHEYGFLTASEAPLAKVTQSFLAHCRTEFRKLAEPTK
jgi:DNA-binding transcriptional LysR family regulator